MDFAYGRGNQFAGGYHTVGTEAFREETDHPVDLAFALGIEGVGAAAIVEAVVAAVVVAAVKHSVWGTADVAIVEGLAGVELDEVLPEEEHFEVASAVGPGIRSHSWRCPLS